MSFRIGNRLNRRWHPWLHGGSDTDLAEIQQPMPDSIRLDVETWHRMRGLGLRDGIEDYEPEVRRYWASSERHFRHGAKAHKKKQKIGEIQK